MAGTHQRRGGREVELSGALKVQDFIDKYGENKLDEIGQEQLISWGNETYVLIKDKP